MIASSALQKDDPRAQSEEERIGAPIAGAPHSGALALTANPRHWVKVLTNTGRDDFADHQLMVVQAWSKAVKSETDRVRPYLWHEVQLLLTRAAQIRTWRALIERAVTWIFVLLVAVSAVAVSAYRSFTGTPWPNALVDFTLSFVFSVIVIALGIALIAACWGIVSLPVAVLSKFRNRIALKNAFIRASNAPTSLILGSVVAVSVMYLGTRQTRLPEVIRTGLVSGTFFTTLYALFLLLGTAIWLAVSVVSRFFRRRHPEGRFIIAMAEYVNELGRASSDRIADWTYLYCKQRLRDLEILAAEFERDWPKWARTGNHHADEAAVRWSRLIAAEVHADEMLILAGVGRTEDHAATCMEILKNFLISDQGAFQRQVPDSVDQEPWWQKASRVTAILLALILAAAFILLGVFQPDLPEQLEAWGLPDVIVDRVSFGSGIQPPLLTVGVAFIGLAAKLISPQVRAPTALPRK